MGMKINEIPNDWKTVKLKDVLLVIRNGLITKQNKEGRGYPITRIETISDEKIDDSKVGYVSDISEEDKIEYRLIEGDILFSHINSLEHIGKTAIYDGRPEFLLHGMNLLLLRPDKSKINPLFLLYLLRFFRMKKIFWNISKKAVNQASINQTELGNLKIPIPPIQEQRIIAQILFTVDKAIQKTDEIIAKTERLKKGLMKELLTGRIRVEEKDGKIVFRKETEFKDTEIGKIPKDWEVVKLSEITTKIKDIDHKMPKKEETGMPFVSIKCMLKYPDLNFYLDFKDPDLEFISKEDYEYHAQRFNVERGDIIYSRFGSIGNAKLVMTDQPFIASYSIVLIKPDRFKVDSIFLTCMLNSERVKKQAKGAVKGATNRNLHLEDIKNFIIPLPQLSEQQKIAEIFSAIDKKLELERKRKEKLERIKKGLMDLLLTGKIRIRVNG
jgi:type I restriction enzyme S subunit